MYCFVQLKYRFLRLFVTRLMEYNIIIIRYRCACRRNVLLQRREGEEHFLLEHRKTEEMVRDVGGGQYIHRVVG